MGFLLPDLWAIKRGSLKVGFYGMRSFAGLRQLEFFYFCRETGLVSKRHCISASQNLVTINRTTEWINAFIVRGVTKTAPLFAHVQPQKLQE